jgi:MFS transporter, DHA1 family, tetracycline resistance protein
MLALAQGLLTGKVIARFGPKRAAMVSILFGLPSYLLLAFAPGGWAIYLAIIIGGFSGITFPAIQSMMSDKVSENAQGELQGAVASVISMTSIAGPVVMTRVFSHFADGRGTYFPGAPFILSAGVLALAIALYAFVIRRTEIMKSGEAPSPQSQSSSQV